MYICVFCDVYIHITNKIHDVWVDHTLILVDVQYQKFLSSVQRRDEEHLVPRAQSIIAFTLKLHFSILFWSIKWREGWLKLAAKLHMENSFRKLFFLRTRYNDILRKIYNRFYVYSLVIFLSAKMFPTNFQTQFSHEDPQSTYV